MKSFKYNGKIWSPKNPEKKLKQLGITWDDVELIEVQEKKKIIEEEKDNIKLYYFINPENNYSITSIHKECKEDGYIPTTLEELQKIWNS